MKVDLNGEEVMPANPELLWRSLNDPTFLTACIPGCKEMIEVTPDAYKVKMELKVASVGGSFDGDISLTDKQELRTCRITVSGGGTLGHGTGQARFEIVPQDGSTTKLVYEGSGEVGGLVAGVGQRILKSISKHLVKRFFTAAKKELQTAAATST
jgi:carbon monoxide dehydrogenase subunit G